MFNNIYYINQGDAATEFAGIIAAMKVKDGADFKNKTYEVRIGGALANDYYVYTITGKQAETIDWGNVDGEGGITATDADWILRKVVNSTLVLANEVAANVDGEGGITATDADWILRKVVNSQLSFPAAAK